MLGEFEQLVLLAILRVGESDAYGIPIRDEIARAAGREPTLGAVYKTLARLEDKGLVRSWEADPTPLRGGRRKRCYAVSAAGRRELRHGLAALRRMTSGLDLGLESP